MLHLLVQRRLFIKCAKGRFFHNYFEEFGSSFHAVDTKHAKNLNIKTVASIQNKAKELFINLRNSQSARVSLIHLEHLVDYLKIHSFARQQVFDDGGVSVILKIRESTRCKHTIQQAHLALTLVGYVDPVPQIGVRILALDGGGSRGVMTIEMLKKIQELGKKPIHELFDLIVGTSTGAILAFLIAIQKKPLSECRILYEKLSTELFKTNQFVNAGKLFVNHAYYETTVLEEIIKSELGSDTTLIETAVVNGPKVAAVSTVVSEAVLQAFVFRNYCFRRNRKNLYMGTSKYKLWQAVRASTAAPGYFQEFLLDGQIHQDGGILTNNPCALAIHEAKALWPQTEIQAIVSIGTGVYHGRAVPHTAQFTTLKEKLSKLVASATDVEAVHTTLQDLLPPYQYIRLNPNMSTDVPLDESRLHVLEELEQDTRNYIEKFHHKFESAAAILEKRKPGYRHMQEHLATWCLTKGLSKEY